MSITHAVGYTLPASVGQFVRNERIDKRTMYGYLIENNLLREDAAREIDEAVVGVARRDLVAYQDIAQFTRPTEKGIGTTEFAYDKLAPVGKATQSMSILNLGDRDLVTFSRTVIPVPVTASQFRLDARLRAAGTGMGQSLDLTNVEEHTRSVAETLEDTLVNGSDVVLGSNGLPGYTNFSCREQLSFSNVAWNASGFTGTDAVTDVIAMRTALRDNGYTGPYTLYLPANMDGVIDEDFKTNSDKSLRQRLLEIDGITQIKVLAALPDDNILLVQMTRSVVEIASGQPITVVTWDEMGGLAVNWAVLAVEAPALKCANARAPLSQGTLPALTTASGVAHLS